MIERVKKGKKIASVALSGLLAFTLVIAQAGMTLAQSDPGANASGTDTRGYTANPGESRALTDYLKDHRLPLVGAQVLHDSAGAGRVVVLYGFVATEFGKADAPQKARTFLRDNNVAIENRIKVNPELLTANRSAPAPASAGAPAAAPPASADADSGSVAEEQARASNSMPGIQGYMDQQSQASAAQQYAPSTQIGGGGSMIPLIALLGVLGMSMMSNGNSSFSMGGQPGYGAYGNSPYGTPFGASPYSPYPGYPPGVAPSGPGFNGSPYGPGGPSSFGGIP